MRIVLPALLGVLMLVTTGCQTTEPASRPETLPAFGAAAERFNRRIERLDTLWARANLTLRSPKESGGTSVDRAEGHLQVRLPFETALTVEKLMETYLHFGSDETAYWWIDLMDSDRRIAIVGLHAEATPELVEELGLPVHPLELLDLFAVTPVPRDRGGSVDWDAGRGLLIVETDGMWGPRRLWLDSVTFAPQRVELIGEDGEVRAISELARYRSVPVRGDGRVPPKMASQYRISLPRTGSRLTLELYDPENRPLKDVPFDFVKLVEAYGVDEVLRLRPGGGEGGE